MGRKPVENDYYSNLYEVDATYGGFKGRNATVTVGALGGTMTGVTISEEGFGYIENPAVTARALNLGDDSSILNRINECYKTALC